MIFLFIYICIALFIVTPYLIWDNVINIDSKIRNALTWKKWITIICLAILISLIWPMTFIFKLTKYDYSRFYNRRDS